MRTRPPLIAAALACLLAAGAPALAQDRPAGARADEQAIQPVDSGHLRHSSDREPGLLAPALSPRQALLVPARRTTTSTRQIAPGVRYTTWDQRDARGPIRAHLLAIDWTTPGVRIDYRNPGSVAATDDVLDMVRRSGGIAGVNGDFYDIGNTGAPLGVGMSAARGLYNARASGWNSAFYLTQKGRPEIGTVPLRGVIKQHPQLTITNVNSHFVAPGGIGVYTPRWGSTPGYQVTQGQEQDIRMLVVRDQVVVANKAKLDPGHHIDGMVLVGRGEGAAGLRRLKKGTKLRANWWLKDDPSMVITGSKFLIDDGIIQVVDDTEMHPRTAIGIDRDTHEVLLLVIDGRQSFSRGYTMVELARMMMDLGADEALNLDGGGSTTMVARQRSGSLGVMNSPSDGFLRHVANSVVVSYHQP
ncbi:MAG: hypothetical protein F2667_00950 [Actinobacteria bacterium]|uniref:Unannotated protein n=1 Tax=freshwater metagenome TaxID=449393 RepID=A0A6J6NQG6_9ZZZZ|nr:hypothetical protein [Actinomycetota bacterium]